MSWYDVTNCLKQISFLRSGASKSPGAMLPNTSTQMLDHARCTFKQDCKNMLVTQSDYIWLSIHAVPTSQTLMRYDNVHFVSNIFWIVLQYSASQRSGMAEETVLEGDTNKNTVRRLTNDQKYPKLTISVQNPLKLAQSQQGRNSTRKKHQSKPTRSI